MWYSVVSLAANFPIEMPLPPISVKTLPMIMSSCVPEMKSRPVAAICVKMFRSKWMWLAFVTLTPAGGRPMVCLLSLVAVRLYCPACASQKPYWLGRMYVECANVSPWNQR